MVRIGSPRLVSAVAVALSTGVALAQPAPRPFPTPPAWVADQTLYEVNLRQFSAEGTVEGFAKQLPRVQALGVGTLWFMPVQPIGVDGRSGKLGSPYAVKDYLAFNPEFGTVGQFKAVVDDAHRRGMFVILDWVATHTALDHPWVTQHPAWYRHDAAGGLVHTMPTWLDVWALDYASADLRRAMIDAMTYWVRDVGVDGFRCDSAEFVPLDFWCQARAALRQVKPVFMLAEGNKPELLDEAFDAAYAWNLPSNTEGIANGTKTVADLTNFFGAEAKLLPGAGFRVNFTTNHDKNAWEGTTRDLLHDGADAFTVLTFTCPGMPLVYDGQEIGDPKRLPFFDRDPIAWHDDPAAGLFRTLARLKRDNQALWDGLGSAPMQFVPDPAHPSVLSFHREFHGDRVAVLLNLGPKPVTVPVPDGAAQLRPVLGDPVNGTTVDLPAWGYRVWATAP